MAVDFSKKVTGGYSDMTTIPDYLDASTNDKRRMLMYNLFYRFYVGRHWRYASEEGIPQLTFNYCKAFVDKSVSFLVGKEFRINSLDEKNKDLVESELNRIWADCGKGLLSLEIAQMGSVTGDAWVKVGYDDGLGRCMITPITPTIVFPKWDPLNMRRLLEVNIVHKFSKSKDAVDSASRDKKKSESHTYREKITPDEIVEYLDGEEVEGSRRENILGVMPVVHIRNIPVANATYGMSDLQPLVSVNKEFNEKATDLTDTLNYQGSPVVVIKGAKARNLERGPNQVWGGLPKDASVSTLDIGSATKPMMEYLEVLKQSMHELSGVPEATLGKMQPISNTSGAALHIQYQPLMEKTRVKRLTYGEGLRKVNDLILRTLEIKEGLNIGVDTNKYATEIIFEDPMPRDRTIELQNVEAELRMGVASKREIMERLGKDKIDGLMDEISKDKVDEEAIPYQAGQQQFQEGEI
tara:strand:+ start:10244 stop:11644 length:1401 start_codon:yes stop_codon:yes gene_type:complete